MLWIRENVVFDALCNDFPKIVLVNFAIKCYWIVRDTSMAPIITTDKIQGISCKSKALAQWLSTHLIIKRLLAQIPVLFSLSILSAMNIEQIPF